MIDWTFDLRLCSAGSIFGQDLHLCSLKCCASKKADFYIVCVIFCFVCVAQFCPFSSSWWCPVWVVIWKQSKVIKKFFSMANYSSFLSLTHHHLQTTKKHNMNKTKTTENPQKETERPRNTNETLRPRGQHDWPANNFKNRPARHLLLVHLNKHSKCMRIEHKQSANHWLKLVVAAPTWSHRKLKTTRPSLWLWNSSHCISIRLGSEVLAQNLLGF